MIRTMHNIIVQHYLQKYLFRCKKIERAEGPPTELVLYLVSHLKLMATHAWKTETGRERCRSSEKKRGDGAVLRSTLKVVMWKPKSELRRESTCTETQLHATTGMYVLCQPLTNHDPPLTCTLLQCCFSVFTLLQPENFQKFFNSTSSTSLKIQNFYFFHPCDQIEDSK
jgi:hypothetical protein